MFVIEWSYYMRETANNSELHHARYISEKEDENLSGNVPFKNRYSAFMDREKNRPFII